MYLCTTCQQPFLKKKNAAGGIFWSCQQCTAQMMAIGILKKTVARDFVNSVWQIAFNQQNAAGVHCPICNNKTNTVECDLKENNNRANPFDQANARNTLVLDVCTLCHMILFDPGELQTISRIFPKTEEKPALKPETQKEIARIMAVDLAKAPIKKTPHVSHYGMGEHSGLKTLLAYIVPVEEHNLILKRMPLLTYALLIFCFLTGLLTFPNLETIVLKYAIIPNDLFRQMGLTPVFSFFLHAGWGHLLGNMYFLYLFGDNVESHLGHWRYLLLIFVSALFGDFCYILFNSNSTVPLIGASGGVSGIMAFYALRYPQAKIVTRLAFLYLVRVSAIVYIGIWLLFQTIFALVSIYNSGGQAGSIAYLSHLGGAIVGLLAYTIWREE